MRDNPLYHVPLTRRQVLVGRGEAVVRGVVVAAVGQKPVVDRERGDAVDEGYRGEPVVDQLPAALEHPEHAHTIARVMAIPTKRHERSTVCYLDLTEITALLAAPDRGTLLGRRDRALLALMIQTAVRVSELVGLRVRDVHLGTGHHIRVLGRVSCAARCPPGGSFGAQLPSEPRGRFRCTWLSGDLCRGSGCCHGG